MKKTSLAVAASTLLLAGCGGFSESNYNPMNWFDGERTETQLAPEDGYVVVTDRRNLVSDVRELRIEPTRGGIIVHARGLPPTQGYYNADLVSPTNNVPVNGVLNLEFRVTPPRTQTLVSTEHSREIWVGYFLSNQELRGVREIRVLGAGNSLSKRRG